MANNGGKIAEGRCLLEVVFPLFTALAGLHAVGVVGVAWTHGTYHLAPQADGMYLHGQMGCRYMGAWARHLTPGTWDATFNCIGCRMGCICRGRSCMGAWSVAAWPHDMYLHRM